MIDPRFLSEMASYDVASNISQALPKHEGYDVVVLSGVVVPEGAGEVPDDRARQKLPEISFNTFANPRFWS